MAPVALGWLLLRESCSLLTCTHASKVILLDRMKCLPCRFHLRTVLLATIHVYGTFVIIGSNGLISEVISFNCGVYHIIFGIRLNRFCFVTTGVRFLNIGLKSAADVHVLITYFDSFSRVTEDCFGSVVSLLYWNIRPFISMVPSLKWEGGGPPPQSPLPPPLYRFLRHSPCATHPPRSSFVMASSSWGVTCGSYGITGRALADTAQSTFSTFFASRQVLV